MAGQWPTGAITYWIDPPALTGLDPDSAASAIEAGIDWWPTVCGVNLRYAASADAANVRIVTAYLDPYALAHGIPAGEVAGLTDEPDPIPQNNQLLMRLHPDLLGGWGLLKLRNVAAHEFGHALGGDHSPSGVRSIMAPELDETLDAPTPYDAAWSQAKYGPPTPAGPMEVVIDSTGVATVDIHAAPGRYTVTLTPIAA